MKNVSIFQIILLSVFGLFLMAGIIVVAIYSSEANKNQTQKTPIVIWGIFDATIVHSVISELGRETGDYQVSYVQKSAATFDTDLSEAIAVGSGPDVVLLRNDFLVSNLQKLTPISYEDYPVRNFRDTFLEEGELFLSSDGIYAMPFAIDPLVMYWNRTLFSQAGLTNPPRYWDELYSLAGQLTKRDGTGAITQSAVALGTYDNVQNAKEILSALFLQSGNKIVGWSSDLSSVNVSLLQAPTAPDNVLSFYTQFADIRKGVYSWSRGLSDSESAFLSNRLGVYFGFASEARNLKAKSPNLNFDTALFPQNRNSSTQSTLGRLYGFAILRSSRNQAVALEVIRGLTSADSAEHMRSVSSLPSVRRDIKAISSSDPFQSVFVQAALVSKGWLDPKGAESNIIFKDMIESVLSGFSNSQQAVAEAERQLRFLIPR